MMEDVGITVEEIVAARRVIRRMMQVALDNGIIMAGGDRAFDGLVEGNRCFDGVFRFIHGDAVALAILEEE